MQLTERKVEPRAVSRFLTCRIRPGSRKADAGSSRLGETDGDGLRGRSRTVFTFTYMVNLFADELARLRAG